MRQAKAKATAAGALVRSRLANHTFFGVVWSPTTQTSPLPKPPDRDQRIQLTSTSQCPSYLSPENSGRGSGLTSLAHLALASPVLTPIGRYFFPSALSNVFADLPHDRYGFHLKAGQCTNLLSRDFK